MDLISEIRTGNRLALARLLTKIENDSQEGREALDKLFAHTGQAFLIGVTGAPGTGKSSLVNQLALHYRKPINDTEPKKVAIVAIDPSSPFTGGAILGDRIRMRELSGDPGVFIRSMASRGALGGIAQTTSGVVQAFDAAGYEIIIIETVGAGQAEIDIARLAHTTLVVEAPGLGDDIQAIKAGILEIADIIVVNKSDRPGVEVTERALRSMLQLAHPVQRHFQNSRRVVPSSIEDQNQKHTDVWIPPILRTTATDGTGLPELLEQIQLHKNYLMATGEWEEREQVRLEAELVNLLQALLIARWRDSISDMHYSKVFRQVVARDISPRKAVKILLDGDMPK